MATSNSSSSSHRKSSPKELLQALGVLYENQKITHEQRQEQEMQQQQECQHPRYQHQIHDQTKHKHQQLDESRREGGRCESGQPMELSQIELIYRAEGNANLVLALPQFKKVLRLPKISKNSKQTQPAQQTKYQETQHCQKSSPKHAASQGQLKQQEEIYQQEPNKTTGQQENEIDAVGILTMDHYVAYISIIRCLVGNEFVFEADIVAVPNPTDRQWINEHIKPYRPANRLDKEFGGHFGLLLPDATRLPAEFDILFSNLQCKNQSATVTTATKTSQCSNSSITTTSSSSSNTDKSCSKSNNIFGSHTFAIEIKPKQGWLLPNDVNNLFDMKPKITQATRTTTTQPPSLWETKTEFKASVATATTTATMMSKAAAAAAEAKASGDNERFKTIQNDKRQAKTTASTTPATKTTTTDDAYKNIRTRITTTFETAETKNYRCCCDNMKTTTTTPATTTTGKTQRDDKISHSLYDKVDIRCRYCSMQFLKLKQQKIFKVNQYCPIDLFSGCPERMENALLALFECPQNNLRVFKNGCLVFDDQISRKNAIKDLFSSDKLQLIKHLLVTCLLREYQNKEQEEEQEEAKSEGKEQINKDTKQQPLARTASTTSKGGVEGAELEKDKEGDESKVGSGVGVSAGQPHSSVTSYKKQKLCTMPKTMATTNSPLTETEVTKVKSTLTSAEAIVSMDNTLTSASDNNTWCLEQINKAEVTCLPKNCVLQKLLHLQLLAKIRREKHTTL